MGQYCFARCALSASSAVCRLSSSVTQVGVVRNKVINKNQVLRGRPGGLRHWAVRSAPGLEVDSLFEYLINRSIEIGLYEQRVKLSRCCYIAVPLTLLQLTPAIVFDHHVHFYSGSSE